MKKTTGTARLNQTIDEYMKNFPKMNEMNMPALFAILASNCSLLFSGHLLISFKYVGATIIAPVHPTPPKNLAIINPTEDLVSLIISQQICN